MSTFFFIQKEIKNYPSFPYHPDKDYLEFKSTFQEFDSSNAIYHYFRRLLIEAKYDQENIGKKCWNPFRQLIKDGQRVVIKPNLVIEEKGPIVDKNCITTHTSFLRPILDYLYLLKKFDKIDVEIIITDTPIQSANFNTLISQNKLMEFVNWYRKKFSVNISLLDLRKEIVIIDRKGFVLRKKIVDGDPLGYTNVHLEESFLNGIISDYKKFAVSGYDNCQTTVSHSNKNSHYYNIPNTIISSDLFINLPKIKTHQKAGITIALKNLIGINGDKSWIPHYRKGMPMFGGDEFSKNNLLHYVNRIINSKLQNKSKSLWEFKKNILSLLKWKGKIKDEFIENCENLQKMRTTFGAGAWYGNDTLWRPILDLNKLLMLIDKKGRISDKIQRKIICFSDGIIASEGDGPLNPTPKNIGLIALSENPVINDICCARILGFDWQKIPQLKNSILLSDIFGFNGDVSKIMIRGSIGKENDSFLNFDFDQLIALNLLAPPGWVGQMELIQ